MSRPMGSEEADDSTTSETDERSGRWAPPWTRRDNPKGRGDDVVDLRPVRATAASEHDQDDGHAALEIRAPKSLLHRAQDETQAASKHDGGADDAALEIRVHGSLVHRAPAAVTSPLRYVLAGTDLPPRLGLSSCTGGEGVTSTSLTLAALVAHDWRADTCWVDLNWWDSTAAATRSELFDFTIADALSGAAKSSALPIATSVDNLWMVAAGKIAPAARAQIPRSEQLWRIMDEVAASFDHVVLDLPPILETADALALGRLSDAYMLVTRQHAVSASEIRAALQTMKTIPCLGVILNGARSKVPRWLRSSVEGPGTVTQR